MISFRTFQPQVYIRCAVCPAGLNKGPGWKFCVDSRVRHETPEEGRRTYRLKHCEYNNEDKKNSLNILSDKNNQASS